MALALIDAGAEVNGRGFRSWEPLHFAVRTGNLALATKLLDHGAKIEAPRHNGWRALHLAVQAGDQRSRSSC